MAQVPCCQRGGKGGGTVSPGGRVPPRCQIILGWIPKMGFLGSTLPHYSPKNVFACHQGGAEGGREVYPLGPLACPAKAKPRGRCAHCPDSWVPNLPEGDLRPTMRYTYSEGCLACHPVGAARWKGPSKRSCLPLGAIYGGERALPCQRRAKGGNHGHPTAQLPNEILLPVPVGDTTTMMKSSERPGRLTSGHLRPLICWSWILTDWVRK